MNLILKICILFASLFFISSETNTDSTIFEYDPNGYIIFCLCMGRFGNQADQFLGSLAFAKGINRTFVVPPFRTYKNVPFKEWFKLEKLAEYHRIISAEDFMEHIAPKYWPKGQRTGFCWLTKQTPISECKMKEGNPFGPFWDELGVDFDAYEKYDYSYYDYDIWKQQFPAEKYPVLAFKGAPATFPVISEHRNLQQYLEWSDNINDEVENFISKTFGDEKYIGIHLRNGVDWENACSYAEGTSTFMASPQCLENTDLQVTKSICLPSHDEILKKLSQVIEDTNITTIYIATDKNPMINEIKRHFGTKDLKLVHHDPWLPVVDVAILSKSDFFIGNCVSSFTSFVKRDRDLHKRPSKFWGFN